MTYLRFLAGVLLVSALTSAQARAMEQWGRVKSVDTRFQKFVLVQEGDNREHVVRLGPDTILVTLDGRVLPATDVRVLLGRRVYVLVEENPEHYAMKMWIRPEIPPERDPINPGVGATPLRPRGDRTR